MNVYLLLSLPYRNWVYILWQIIVKSSANIFTKTAAKHSVLFSVTRSARTWSQSILRKNVCDLISVKPVWTWQPNRSFGSCWGLKQSLETKTGADLSTDKPVYSQGQCDISTAPSLHQAARPDLVQTPLHSFLLMFVAVAGRDFTS